MALRRYSASYARDGLLCGPYLRLDEDIHFIGFRITSIALSVRVKARKAVSRVSAS
jgi:hypothetical protein